MAFHFQKTLSVSAVLDTDFLLGRRGRQRRRSLLFGRLFDRVGMKVLLPLTAITTLSAPLAFLGGFKLALLGAGLWGLGMGVHESIIPAAVATMVPAQRRPSAYGLFTAAYGVFWFLGSALIGFLYDRSIPAVIVFSVVAELAAIPLFLSAARAVPRSGDAEIGR